MTFRMLAVLLWAAGFLVLAEVGVEWRAHGRGFPTILFGDRPTAIAQESGQNAGRWGPRAGFPFRNAVVPERKRDGATRVWISSSSYAEAMNVEVEESFPNRLPALMKACGRDVEVLDPMSRGGADIPAVTDEVETMGPAWRPDVAFLYQMSNDITGISKGLFGGAGAPPADADEKGRVALPVEEPPNWTVRVVHNTTVFEQLRTQVTARLAQARILEESLGAAGDRIYEARLRAWIAACRAIGATPVLSTFATSHDRHHREDIPDSVATQLFTYNMFLSLDGWIVTIDRWNEIALRVAKEERVAIADIRAVLSGRPEFYSDFFHWTPEGHRIFAETLAKVLCTLPAAKEKPPAR
jgi:hypothetical protein